MNLTDIGTTPAICCAIGTPIGQVAKQMKECNVGAVVVTTADNTLAGIVTDRDLVVRGVAAGLGFDSSVEDVMSNEVASVLATASPMDAARQLAIHTCRRLPIVDDEYRLVGVVSQDDLIRHDSEALQYLGDLVRHQHA